MNQNNKKMELRLNIAKVKSYFNSFDDEKARVLVDTLYEYSVLVFNIYNKIV